MNVSGGTIYSMYNQEKYVNKKLDPQKKSVYIVYQNANTVRSHAWHVAQLMTLPKFIFQVISFAQAVYVYNSVRTY